MRSIDVGWRRGSVLAVDAGVHLAAIKRILQPYIDEANRKEASKLDAASPGSPASEVITLSSGPFAGLELPYETAGANAARITRDLIDTYLITHPHLDHISAFVVNTASLSTARPKRLAGLPSTISAFKEHIFNNVIWPNLSDENNGAGLVTYTRLVEGGSAAIGFGDNMGYVEVTEGLGVKTWSVSHGHCMERHSHRGSSIDLNRHGLGSHDYSSTIQSEYDSQRGSPRLRPVHSLQSHPSHIFTRRFPADRSDDVDKMCVYDSCAYFIQDLVSRKEVLIFGDVEPDALSLSPRNHQIWTDAAPKIADGLLKGLFIECSYTDSRPDHIMFGHLCPRYLIAELKVLASLVQSVIVARKAQSPDPDNTKKRKRLSKNTPMETYFDDHSRGRTRRSVTPNFIPLSITPIRPGLRRVHTASVSPMSRPSLPRVQSGLSVDQYDDTTPSDRDPFDIGPPARFPASPMGKSVGAIQETLEESGDSTPPSLLSEDHRPSKPITRSMNKSETSEPPDVVPFPLKGLKVVVIHVKEKLEEEEVVGETILKELLEYEEVEQLGCEFVISEPGMSVSF